VEKLYTSALNVLPGVLCVGAAVSLAGCDDKRGAEAQSLSGVESTSDLQQNADSSPGKQPASLPTEVEPQLIPATVELDGSSPQLSMPLVSEGPRLYSRQLFTWVYERASFESRRLGYLRAGSSAPRSSKAV